MVTSHSSHGHRETSPLITGMSTRFVRSSWAYTVVAALVLVWCVVDFWNHEMSNDFFMMQKFQYGLPHEGSKTFESPLTLALIQFVFMGVTFLALWAFTSKTPREDLSELKGNIFDRRWAGMVVTHVFSIYWVQAMVMPMQLMPLGIFAASRAVEIPATAVLRSQFIDRNVRLQSPFTALMGFTGAFLMLFAYSQIAECLCIWSGHGVMLSGVALYLAYALVLVLPAANAVCQEAVMAKYGTHSLLVLAAQNILACVLCIPILILAYFAGWENFWLAMHMILSRSGMIMLVVWLCVQMTLLSVVGIEMITTMDSFWAVALRSLRVVVWWCKELFLWCVMSKVSLSVGRPDAAIWSCVMVFGIMVVVASMVNDYSDGVMHKTAKQHLFGAAYGYNSA